MALAIFMAMALQATPAANVPRVRQLAEQWVMDEEKGPVTWTLRMMLFEAELARRSQDALGLSDPTQKEQVRAAIHGSLQTLTAEIVEDRISELAQTYSADEIAEMIAFRHSDVGKAYSAGSTQLALELMLGPPDAKASDDPKPSPQKLALINRLLKAEGVEARIRRQQRAGAATVNEMKAEPGGAGEAATQVAAMLKTDDPAYVTNMMTATVRFDAKTYSDEQLRQLLVYFEGPVGRALIASGPRLEAIAITRSRAILEHGIWRAGEAGCQAIACDASQHQKLDGAVAKFEKLVTAGLDTLAN
ncbi:hypothetical protein [Phenylobacterium sp.]|uniref:hypothetical protein n=1 Tax=Phenylobacterium sp. TaxID=1871053 RepID=UPI002C868148|nr:hypothetical protein [Phenylobacterium sp.]HLZ73846.1 hypothetical protein [Phenylobacterium sp.]